jgi:hypothetical protein
MSCSFCGEPDYCGSTISPRMCEKHFGLVLVGMRLVRSGAVVTVNGIRRELRRLDAAQRASLKFEEHELRDLLIQLEKGGYTFPIGSWKKNIKLMQIGNGASNDENTDH